LPRLPSFPSHLFLAPSPSWLENEAWHMIYFCGNNPAVHPLSFSLSLACSVRLQHCKKVGQAEELCLRALRLSEVHAEEEWQHVESLFQFARFQHEFRGSDPSLRSCLCLSPPPHPPNCLAPSLHLWLFCVCTLLNLSSSSA